MPEATAPAPAPTEAAKPPKPKKRAAPKTETKAEAPEKEAPPPQEEAPAPEEEETQQPNLSMPRGGGSIDLWNPTPMQNFVLGAGLIGLNFFTQTNLVDLVSRIWTAPKSASDVSKLSRFGPASLLTLAGEGFFVLVLSFVTGLSGTVGRAVTLFYLALYLVWITFNGQKLVGIRAALDAAGNATQINTTGTSGSDFIGGIKK